MNYDIITTLLPIGLSVITFFIGQKTGAKKDGKSAGYFEGIVTAKLDALSDKIGRLEKVYDHVNEKIIEHERAYHYDGNRTS